MHRIGADILSQLFASSMMSEKLRPRENEHTYLNKEVEKDNGIMMTQLADVRMAREMSIAVARQVSHTFKIALVKQGCLLGFCLERTTGKVLKNYVSLVFRDRMVTLNVHKLTFANKLHCPLRGFVFRSIAKLVRSTAAFVGSNVKEVELCIMTLYNNFCTELAPYRMSDDMSKIQEMILEWANNSSHVSETTLSAETPLLIKLKVQCVYYTVYAIHQVPPQLKSRDLSAEGQMQHTIQRMQYVSECMQEIEFAEQIYACFCRARPSFMLTFLPLTTATRRRLQNAIDETLPSDPRRVFLLGLLWRNRHLTQIMQKYIDKQLRGTVSHLDACRAVPGITLKNK